VILLTDLNSRIPVSVEPGNIQAIMAGDNTGAPTLDLLSQNVAPKPGSQVISSGDGGLLPPGLAIGSVVADPSGGFRVVLLADSASSEDVNVVDFKLKSEQPPAPSPNQLPATAAGLPPAAPPASPATAAPLATNPIAGAPPTVQNHISAPPAAPPPKPQAHGAPSPEGTAADTGNE
jgi:rod shape-determining protein MreC